MSEWPPTFNRERQGLRALYYDARPFMWVGGALLVVALMFFIVVRTSPGGWQWWSARAVPGTEQGGIVYYTYKGASETVEDPQGITNVPVQRTVYVDPSNPNIAVLSITVPQISDSLFAGLPLLAAVGFFAFAVFRHRRIGRTREVHPDGEFGYGITSDVVARLRAQQQLDAQKGRSPPPPFS